MKMLSTERLVPLYDSSVVQC